jgi:hypothetical protein
MLARVALLQARIAVFLLVPRAAAALNFPFASVGPRERISQVSINIGFALRKPVLPLRANKGPCSATIGTDTS